MAIFLILFYILIIATSLFPSYGAIDKIGFQWLYLSILMTIIYISFLIKNTLKKDELILLFKKYKSVFLPIFIFIFISFLSILYSFNKSEALITSGRYLLIFLILFFFIYLYDKRNQKNIFVLTLYITLTIEILASFILIFNDIKSDNFFLRKPLYGGVAANVNILTALILPKIPIILNKMFYTKKYLTKGLFFILLQMSFIVLLSLGSRITFVILLCYALIFIFWIFKSENLKLGFKKGIFLLFLVLMVKFNFDFINKVNSNNQNILNQRLESTIELNGSDDSINSRLRYYKHSIEMFFKNPMIGIGSGNWKIESIAYDKKYIRNYIVPYHTHNDFLQILAELGVLGLIAYLTFLMVPVIKVIQKLKSKDFNFWIFILMSIVAFFLDALLNFPIARPVNQILLMTFIAFIVTTNWQSNEE